jgi:hypothetical protein
MYIHACTYIHVLHADSGEKKEQEQDIGIPKSGRGEKYISSILCRGFLGNPESEPELSPNSFCGRT